MVFLLLVPSPSVICGVSYPHLPFWESSDRKVGFFLFVFFLILMMFMPYVLKINSLSSFLFFFLFYAFLLFLFCSRSPFLELLLISILKG